VRTAHLDAYISSKHIRSSTQLHVGGRVPLSAEKRLAGEVWSGRRSRRLAVDASMSILTGHLALSSAAGAQRCTNSEQVEAGYTNPPA
jgi:hypothetical protein